MADLEESEEFPEESAKEFNDANKRQNPLDRESILNSPNLKKKGFGVFGLVLMGIAALLLIFLFNGKDRSKNDLQKESVEFEPASKREVILPPPIFKTPEEDPEKLKQEEAIRQARLKSAIVIYGNESSNVGAERPSPLSRADVQADSSNGGGGDPNVHFQQDVGNHSDPRVEASNLGSLDQIILQGKLIDAVLETAIHSDLPGMVRALISRDVYAESGEQVLIPRGSRLVGQYNSQIAKGQSRVFIVWTRVIRPDGIEVSLNSGGTDPLGRAGIGGSVNHHFWQIFGASTLLSIIGGGTANAGVNPSDQYNSVSAYRQQLAQGFQNSSASLLEGYINIPPTIQIKQGTPVKVFVAHDLDFEKVLASMSQTNEVIFP